tara:strand:- start:6901 stop:7095 length:195 start_codon:yes stop_codon:yes gene_type:complete
MNMQTSYGIVGIENVTVTMTTTADELPRVTNSEGSVVVGTNMTAHRNRLVRDGAEEVKIFPLTA